MIDHLPGVVQEHNLCTNKS